MYIRAETAKKLKELINKYSDQDLALNIENFICSVKEFQKKDVVDYVLGEMTKNLGREYTPFNLADVQVTNKYTKYQKATATIRSKVERRIKKLHAEGIIETLPFPLNHKFCLKTGKETEIKSVLAKFKSKSPSTKIKPGSSTKVNELPEKKETEEQRIGNEFINPLPTTIPALPQTANDSPQTTPIFEMLTNAFPYQHSDSEMMEKSVMGKKSERVKEIEKKYKQELKSFFHPLINIVAKIEFELEKQSPLDKRTLKVSDIIDAFFNLLNQEEYLKVGLEKRELTKPLRHAIEKIIIKMNVTKIADATYEIESPFNFVAFIQNEKKLLKIEDWNFEKIASHYSAQLILAINPSHATSAQYPHPTNSVISETMPGIERESPERQVDASLVSDELEASIDHLKQKLSDEEAAARMLVNLLPLNTSAAINKSKTSFAQTHGLYAPLVETNDRSETQSATRQQKKPRYG